MYETAARLRQAIDARLNLAGRVFASVRFDVAAAATSYWRTESSVLAAPSQLRFYSRGAGGPLRNARSKVVRQEAALNRFMR